jgi:hypothetical protein
VGELSLNHFFMELAEVPATRIKMKSINKMSRRKITVVYSKRIRKGIQIKAVVEGKVLFIVGAKAAQA